MVEIAASTSHASLGTQDRDADRRAGHRVSVRLPVGVRGTDLSGLPFEEKTFSADLCRAGMAFVLLHVLQPGADVEIHLPLPSPVGKKELADFVTYGKVRHVQLITAGSLVGVLFTGPQLHRLFLPESAPQH